MSEHGPWSVPGSTRFRKHEHEGGHICVVLAGGFVERESTGWRDVASGTTRVSGAARHDIDFSPTGATCLVLEIDAPVRLPASPRFFENDTRLDRIARSLAAAGKDHDPGNRLLVEDVKTEFLAQVSRRLDNKTRTPPSWLAEIRELINDEPERISVADLADHAGVHRVHLARAFHEHYGVSVTRYVRSVRARRALNLMLSHQSLSQIALESGYSDQSHLTRELKNLTGSTPKSLRSMLHPFKTASASRHNVNP